MKPIHYTWTWDLDSSPEALWPLVTNTDRFNGATGIPAITHTETPLPDGGTRRIITQRIYGVTITYEEDPFEWVYQQRMTRLSRYWPQLLNPLKEFRVELTLEPLPTGGSRLVYQTWTTPANLLGLIAVPIQINGLYRRRFDRVFREMDAYAQAKLASMPLPPQQTPISAVGRARIRDLSLTLNEARQNPTIIANLMHLIEKAPDVRLYRMRPFALADEWGVDRYDTLDVFLRATQAGLLDLSWDMICPDCRGAKHQSSALSGVSRYGYCPSCNIDFEVDFGKTIEATFQVNSAIRPVVRQEFCIGNPQNSPHIVVQQRLQPGESRQLAVRLGPGRYRWLAPLIAAQEPGIRSPQTALQSMHGQVHLNVHKGAPDSRTALIIDNEVSLLHDTVAPGEVVFTLTNETDHLQQVSLGRLDYTDQAVTAAEITSLQTFRDLFPREALRPGETISVENLTLLFTDLKGSTSMYRQFGDAIIFKRVMDHFDILRDNVRAEQGALVKTIGDAIMAVFTDPVHAIRAAVRILSEMNAYNARENTNLTLKMGIHRGSCIAVTLNERLDYFGSTVNLAARLESLSLGNDLIISEQMATDPGVMELIKAQGMSVEEFDATIKGFDELIHLRRVRALPVSASQRALVS